MAENIWDKFDSEFDSEELAKDIENAADGGGDFEEVPDDTYEVKITTMELTESKSGKPMVKTVMKILDGPYKGRLIFWYKVLTQAFMFSNKYKNGMNDFLTELVSGLDKPMEIRFKNWKQYHNLLLEVHEAIDGNFEYAVRKCRNEKKPEYTDYFIEEVYPLED